MAQAFPDDAAHDVALPGHRGVDAGGFDELADLIVLESVLHAVEQDLAIALAGVVEQRGQEGAADQAPGLVVGVAGDDGFLATALVAGLDELADLVVGVALGSAVKAGFLDQSVKHVVVEVRLRTVLVGQGDQAPGHVAGVFERLVPLLALQDTAVGVAPVAGEVAAGVGDPGQLAPVVIGVSDLRAVGLVDGLDLAQRVAAVAQGFIVGVGHAQEQAPGVVAVAGGLARAVGVAGELAEHGPGELLDAAFGVDDLAGVFGGQAGSHRAVRVEIAVRRDAAIRGCRLEQARRGVVPEPGDGPIGRGNALELAARVVPVAEGLAAVGAGEAFKRPCMSRS